MGEVCAHTYRISTLCASQARFLVPDVLELANAEDGCISTEVLKSKPAMFTSEGLTVHQYFATSLDGTKIPYFVICRADMALDGTNATLLDAYGGFEISMLPYYSAGVGGGGAFALWNFTCCSTCFEPLKLFLFFDLA